MKKLLARTCVPVLLAGGIAAASLGAASPANAACITVRFPTGYSETCDNVIRPDGLFLRCVTTFVIIIGVPNCYDVNINNMSNQHFPFYIG